MEFLQKKILSVSRAFSFIPLNPSNRRNPMDRARLRSVPTFGSFHPTAIGWLGSEKEAFGASQHAAWETMMRSHAIANGLFVAAVNRTGVEEQLEFWGASFACDPSGNFQARASHDAEETLLVECDLDQLDAVRTHWPFLRDRRIDAYGDLLKRYLD